MDTHTDAVHHRQGSGERMEASAYTDRPEDVDEPGEGGWRDGTGQGKDTTEDMQVQEMADDLTLTVSEQVVKTCTEEDTVDGGEHTVDDGEHTVDDGEHIVDDGEHTVDDGEHTMDDGEHAVDDREHTVDDGKHTVDDGEHTADGGERVVRTVRTAAGEGPGNGNSTDTADVNSTPDTTAAPHFTPATFLPQSALAVTTAHLSVSLTRPRPFPMPRAKVRIQQTRADSGVHKVLKLTPSYSVSTATTTTTNTEDDEKAGERGQSCEMTSNQRPVSDMGHERSSDVSHEQAVHDFEEDLGVCRHTASHEHEANLKDVLRGKEICDVIEFHGEQPEDSQVLEFRGEPTEDCQVLEFTSEQPEDSQVLEFRGEPTEDCQVLEFPGERPEDSQVLEFPGEPTEDCQVLEFPGERPEDCEVLELRVEPPENSEGLELCVKPLEEDDVFELDSSRRSSNEASYDREPPAPSGADGAELVVTGDKTFKSEVVVQLLSGQTCPETSRLQELGREEEEEERDVGSKGSSPPDSELSENWSPRSSEEGAGRGKRTDANGSGNLGLKEVEFKLDIGKRRLPSPDVKRTSVEKERAPEFVVKPRRQFVDEGQNAKFKVAFEGSPSTRLSWSRNGKPLNSSNKFKMYEDGGYHYLEVCDVSKEDSGMYVGTVTNAAGTDTAAAELDVFEKPKLLTRGSPPPTLSSSLQDIDVVIGDRDVKLKCQVRGGERCTATWFHNGREVRQGRQHRCVFTGTTASLTLTEVGEEDGGEYQCVIKNANGEVSTSCSVSTQEGEKLEPPVFVKELQDMEVEDGDKVELIVEVKGSQPIQVYWMHNNRQLTVDTPGVVLRAVDGVHSLSVPRANADSGGEYVCEAYNDYGDTDTFCRLHVKEVDKSHPPEFLTRPKPMTVPEGSSAVTFTCRVQGHPLPSVSWERNGCQLSVSEHYKISKDGERHSLEILKPQSQDSGQYVCHVQNSAGTASHNCSLIVTEASGNSASGTSAAGTTDFRALLKPRQGGVQHRPQRSVDSDRSDKENQVHDFRHVLRNTRQHSLPISTISATTTTSTSTTATSRFSHKTVPNGTSTQSSSSSAFSLSSVSSSASGKSGGVRKNLELFENRASTPPDRVTSRQSPDNRPSPDRSALTSRQSPDNRKPPDRSALISRQSPDNRPSPDRSALTSRQSPDNRPPPDRLGLKSRNSASLEIRSSPGQDIVKDTSLQDRRPDPTQENVLTTTTIQPSQAAPVISRERPKERSVRELKACSTHGNFSKSLDRIHWRKNEMTLEPPKSDFRSVLSKPQGASEHIRDTTDSSKPSWARPDPSRDQKKNGHNKDVKQTDFRSVLKTRQVDDGKTSSVNKDSKPKVQSTQSETDFRSVLTKLKQGGDERKPTPSKTAHSRVTPERTTVSKESSSKDLNSLRSKFESPAQDVNTVQSKPSKPSTVLTTTASAITPSSQSGTSITNNTTSHWREGSREKPTVKTVDVMSSLNDTSRFSDDLKCSDSSQLSDSAISSAFSKLSELSDLSDSSSAVSEAESLELHSRRRLERLKERLGGGGGSGDSEGVEDTSEAPSIHQRLENCCVTYGGQVVLQCKVSGVPAPDISWSVNQKAIKPSRFFQLSYQENVAQLLVAEAFSEDEGEYTCTATNSAGTDSCSCYLTVAASSSRSSRSSSHRDVFEGAVSTPPRVESLTPSTLTVRRGQPASFQLTFSGEPAPKITWHRAKTPLQTDDRMTIVKESGTSTLTILSTSANDSGRYTVTLANDLGSDQLSATLSVEDVPECPVGTPHVYDISRKSVSLSWCGPAYDGGSVITHYIVEVKDSDSKEWSTLIADCKSTSYHALTLKADTSYRFRVRAVNRLGLSEPSLPTSPVVMSDPLQASEDYESDDELPFEPREVSLTPGRKFEDHYEYLHEVGKGKFGSVYKCKDKQTGKIWAAKVLKVREKDKAGVRQEVEVMNRLAHPKLLMLWDAFEAPRTMVLVMEFVGAGELFERVIRDDFVLTERDCVHFVRQICTGVGYMHSKSILHLDLKPENVLCVAENSNQIKIIDFGLARFYKPGDSLQVLFGTPEFIAPEVINYDAINYATDMWSIGVICYILLSGLSPFLGDNDAETLSNVTSGEYDFDDESFDDISDRAKDFIGHLLVKRKEKRLTIADCEKHRWLSEEDQRIRCKRLNTDRLRCFMARRKWQKTGNAIRALGRMASLQKLLSGGSTSHSSSGSLSSVPDTPTGAPSAFSVSTPDFSPSGKLASSAHPLSSEAVREVEEKRGVTPAAATTTTTTTTSRGADKGKGDSKLSAETNGGDSVKAVTATAAATTTAADRQASPSSWRRGRQEEGGGLDISSSPLAPSGRSKLTKQDALAGPDVTDNAQKAPQEERVRTSPQSRATAATITTNNKNETDRFSPSQALHGAPADSNPDKRCAPRFLKEMVDCTAFMGDAVRFDVTVTGSPPPRLTWLLEEEEVEEDERHIVELGENGQCSLIIRHVDEDDEGEYLCKAVSSQGEASCTADLHVYSMGAV